MGHTNESGSSSSVKWGISKGFFGFFKKFYLFFWLRWAFVAVSGLSL